jgi:hypothetical protein
MHGELPFSMLEEQQPPDALPTGADPRRSRVAKE